MNFVTIDFSLNSPGICVFSEDKYYFIGYLKPGTGTKKEQKMQEELGLLQDTQISHQPNWTNNENYSKSEMIKVQRHMKTAEDIINFYFRSYRLFARLRYCVRRIFLWFFWRN